MTVVHSCRSRNVGIVDFLVGLSVQLAGVLASSLELPARLIFKLLSVMLSFLGAAWDWNKQSASEAPPGQTNPARSRLSHTEGTEGCARLVEGLGLSEFLESALRCILSMPFGASEKPGYFVPL